MRSTSINQPELTRASLLPLVSLFFNYFNDTISGLFTATPRPVPLTPTPGPATQPPATPAYNYVNIGNRDSETTWYYITKGRCVGVLQGW